MKYISEFINQNINFNIYNMSTSNFYLSNLNILPHVLLSLILIFDNFNEDAMRRQ